MESFETQIFGKGRITIPSKIRKKQGIKEGDYVRVEGLKKLVLVEENHTNKEAE